MTFSYSLLLVLNLSLPLSFAKTTPQRGPTEPEMKCDDLRFDQASVTEKKPGGNWIRKWRGQLPKPSTFSVDTAGTKLSVHAHEYHSSIKPATGTVVYLCGGPGFACTQEGRPKNVPVDKNVIVFDYLGIGQNRAAGRNSEAMSIESQGDVLAALVKTFSLRDYVIYGTSFGTAVATAGVARIQIMNGIPKPRAVILDGVVGSRQSMDRTDSQVNASDRAWSILSSTDKNKLKSSYQKLTRTLTPDQLEELDEQLVGTLNQGPRASAEALRMFGHNPDGDWASVSSPVDYGRDDDTNTPDPGTPVSFERNISAARQYRAAGCQIKAKATTKVNKGYFGGLIGKHSMNSSLDDVCRCPLIDRVYNPANFSLGDVPLIYINSDTDTATPLKGAQAHYDSQVNSPRRVFFKPKDEGHGAFVDGRIARCREVVWAAAFSSDIASLETKKTAIEKGECLIQSRARKQNRTVDRVR